MNNGIAKLRIGFQGKAIRKDLTDNAVSQIPSHMRPTSDQECKLRVRLNGILQVKNKRVFLELPIKSVQNTLIVSNGGAFFYFLEKFSPPQNGEFFESQKEEHFHFSKNSPRAPLKSMQSFFPDPMYPNQNVRNFPDVI